MNICQYVPIKRIVTDTSEINLRFKLLFKEVCYLRGQSSGGIQSIVAGTNITVDDTDPQNPIISSSSGATLQENQIAFGDATNQMTSSSDFTYDLDSFRVGFGGNQYIVVDTSSDTYLIGDYSGAGAGNMFYLDPSLAYLTNGAENIPFGINISSPDATLHVRGNSIIEDSLKVGDNLPPTEALDVVGNIKGSGGLQLNMVQATLTTAQVYTVLETDYIIYVDNAADNVIVLLPNTVEKGKIFIIKRWNSTSTGTIQIGAAGPSGIYDPIDGTIHDDFFLPLWGSPYSVIQVAFDNAHYQVIN